MGELANFPLLPSDSKRVAVCSKSEITALNSSVTHITVRNNCANDASFTVLDLTRFTYLTVFTVGDESLMYVNELKLIGFQVLRGVKIGKNSFTKSKNGYGNDANRHFYLKNCPRVELLNIGRYSFSDYGVCQIDNGPSLEVIEMGQVGQASANFYYASLELKRG